MEESRIGDCRVAEARRLAAMDDFEVTLEPGGMEKSKDDPRNQALETRLANLRAASRCGAKTRAGGACQCPAMRGRRRCRLHGGKSPGASQGPRNWNCGDGHWTAEAIEECRWLRSLVREFGTKGPGMTQNGLQPRTPPVEHPRKPPVRVKVRHQPQGEGKDR